MLACFIAGEQESGGNEYRFPVGAGGLALPTIRHGAIGVREDYSAQEERERGRVEAAIAGHQRVCIGEPAAALAREGVIGGNG